MDKQIKVRIVHSSNVSFDMEFFAPNNWSTVKADFKNCKSELANAAAACEDRNFKLDRFTAVFHHTLLPDAPDVEVPFWLALTPSTSYFDAFIGHDDNVLPLLRNC